VKEKILIVEDEPRNRRLLEMALRAKGYTLLEAANGGEALDIAMRERPDLILMNIQLPKVNGLAVTKKLRETPEFRHTPIIAITGYAMKGDREIAINAGCDAYLSKPINTKELPGMIEAMLLQRQRDSSRHQRSRNGEESPIS